MKKLKLILIDACCIIELFKTKKFEIILDNFHVYISETVLNETKYYRINNEKFEINLNQYISSEKIKILNASSIELDKLTKKIPKGYFWSVGSQDLGEMESLTILEQNKDYKFCTIDQIALKVAVIIGLENQLISYEMLLQKANISNKNIPTYCNNETFKRVIKEAKAIRLQSMKLK
ncbi:MAG: hypothetical protein WC002_10370 [Candidatus Muiribacteriota bacterium]